MMMRVLDVRRRRREAGLGLLRSIKAFLASWPQSTQAKINASHYQHERGQLAARNSHCSNPTVAARPSQRITAAASIRERLILASTFACERSVPDRIWIDKEHTSAIWRLRCQRNDATTVLTDNMMDTVSYVSNTLPAGPQDSKLIA